MKKTILTSLMALFMATAQADDFAEVEKTLREAMKSPARTEKEIRRDANRLPVETLKFFGLRPDMKVLEIMPGGGWYSKLIAPVVVDEGELYVSLGTTNFATNQLGKAGLEFVTVLDTKANLHKPEGSRFFTADEFDFGPRDFDLVLTFRNYHNLDEQGRRRLNEAVFRALKPGGIYGNVDHTRRHMEPTNDENRRRIDPVLAIKEAIDAGFEFVGYSDLHYRPVDELIHEVGKKEVTGRTDRFTLKFRKPE